jgi:hypothetical protein
MSDASFEGIRGGDGRRRTWRSDIMTTPPPVYESPRWLPPPIASTEGGRRLVSQTLGRLGPDAVSYIRGASGEDSDSATERSHASGGIGRGLGFGSSRRVRGSTRANTATVDARPRTHGTTPTLCPPGGTSIYFAQKMARDQKSAQNQTQMKK